VAIHLVAGERKSFQIHRAQSAPVIDGHLEDQVWQRASRVDDFQQIVPNEGEAPTEKTVVYVAYDDEYLYIAADMRDGNPDQIRAKQMVQGRTFSSDDRFYVVLDSFNSKRNDYFFQVNPNGVRRDALRENNDRFIDEWTTIWVAEAAIHENGWAAEIAIPFKSISFSPDSTTWGINFGRGIMRKLEFVLWSSHERQDWSAYGGEVHGIENIEQGMGLDIVPSVNLGRQRDLALGESDSGLEPSVDIRYRMTPSLSAMITLNTDFSTAEVDDQQIVLDRFSLFFPEKRDFFLQDAGIFEFGNIDTNGRPFFSRRIGLAANGEPVGVDGGVKLAGRVGNLNIGALAIRQESFGDVEAKDLLVARGSYNVLDESSVGFIMTYGDPTSNVSNSVLGVDFLYRDSDGPFGEILTGQFWAQKSRTSDLNGDDQAFGARLTIPSDKLWAYAGVQNIEENFNPALGFVNRVGVRISDAGVRYRYRPKTGRWRAINARIDVTNVSSIDGGTLSRTVRFSPNLFSHRGDFLLLGFERRVELVRNEFLLFGRLGIPAGDYKFDRIRAEVSSGTQRTFSATLSLQRGGFFGGDRFEKFVELQWRQSAHFFLGLGFTQNEVDLPSGSFTSNLASLRADVAFNSRWSWSNFVQYENAGDTLGISSRLRFIPEAGKEMVLVLNHGGTVDPSGSFSSTQSNIILKLSYTFRY